MNFTWNSRIWETKISILRNLLTATLLKTNALSDVNDEVFEDEKKLAEEQKQREMEEKQQRKRELDEKLLLETTNCKE